MPNRTRPHALGQVMLPTVEFISRSINIAIELSISIHLGAGTGYTSQGCNEVADAPRSISIRLWYIVTTQRVGYFERYAF